MWFRLADLRTVRTTRARIIWLKNDYKDLMNHIEKGLHDHHASLQAAEAMKPQTPPTPINVTQTQPGEAPETPFAKVNALENGSPANEAGLRAGDKIRTFGSANWMNHEHLRKVGEVVQRNEGVSISFRPQPALTNAAYQRSILVKVVRDEPAQEMQLRVTPRRNWGGRGTLGCHILPL